MTEKRLFGFVFTHKEFNLVLFAFDFQSILCNENNFFFHHYCSYYNIQRYSVVHDCSIAFIFVQKSKWKCKIMRCATAYMRLARFKWKIKIEANKMWNKSKLLNSVCIALHFYFLLSKYKFCLYKEFLMIAKIQSKTKQKTLNILRMIWKQK